MSLWGGLADPLPDADSGGFVQPPAGRPTVSSPLDEDPLEADSSRDNPPPPDAEHPRPETGGYIFCIKIVVSKF